MIDRSDRFICTCEVCGGGFRVKPYRLKTARFCSQKCGSSWHARTRLNTGSKPYMIGNIHRLGLRPTNAFTSEEMRGESNHKWKPGALRFCENCGGSFKQKPWHTRQNGRARFCGRSCFKVSGCFEGRRSPSYVGGQQTYRGRSWKRIRMRIVEAQNGCCADCGKDVGKSLPIHHKRPFREFATADEANVPDNLIGLCQPCHMRREPRKRRIVIASPAPAKQLSLLEQDANA